MCLFDVAHPLARYWKDDLLSWFSKKDRAILFRQNTPAGSPISHLTLDSMEQAQRNLAQVFTTDG